MLETWPDRQDASCLSSTITVLLWLLETRASELIAAAAIDNYTARATSSGGGGGGGGIDVASSGEGDGGCGEGVLDGGAAATVRLMEGVFGR